VTRKVTATELVKVERQQWESGSSSVVPRTALAMDFVMLPPMLLASVTGLEAQTKVALGLVKAVLLQ